ncbi:MobQ family relaxase [Bradyrhizobium sp. G127]|uniref:MobQ family relaxase n=1 Tax=Bradyrhizobium sp. G127 TaxID=2904800 RepID=UPI001F47DA56|nr:MobQ family relaxase [Bradyrhizobium sp. G127]MCF2525406.1 MobA/MobL family protein [Bradyrhizobium sp. G127]
MASYHFSAQAVKRSEGRSVVAMAAYRAGEKLRDERRGVDADYTRRRGVVHAEIIAPEGSAEWLLDREKLWNGVEKSEVRRDAQLAREINMALPCELTDEQRLVLVREFVAAQFVSLGMVADFAIHAPVAEKGDDPRNFHAHVLLTMRQAGGGGFRRVKTREWNSDAMLAKWRAAWAEHQNRVLRERGHAVKVDHRSLEVQRVEAVARREPRLAAELDRLAEIHVGPKARKAGFAGTPQSRDREAGPFRIRELPSPVRRMVRYPELDKGSRANANIKRLGANSDRFAARAAKIERQAERMRRRQAYYESLIAKEQSASQDQQESFKARRARYEHALKRREQVAFWLAELDKLFFAVLGIRESQFMRRTVWSNRMGRWQRLDLEPTRGGGRNRTR